MIFGIAALISRLFTPTVDSALGDIERFKSKMIRVRQYHSTLAVQKREFASKMIGEATEHTNEAMRAGRLEDRVNNFLI